MKNLLTYTHPDHAFFGIEDNLMIETQIENSLELGWKKEDIILATNFPYEYMGVKSVVVSDDCMCSWWKQVSKIDCILWLFDNGRIKDDIYWFHDLDAFEAYPLEFEKNLEDGIDIYLTDYGYRYRKWNTGSFFFNNKSRDIFQMIWDRCHEIDSLEKDKDLIHAYNEERSLEHLTGNNINNINSRIKKINPTYNFPGSNNGFKNFEMVYERCEKPVKVPHFHPLRWGGRFYRMFDGGNPLKVKMLPERLIKIFNKKGAYGTRHYGVKP